MSAFFKDLFQPNFVVQKAFLWNMLLSYRKLYDCTVYIAKVYVEVYILAQWEKYSLLWKAKPLAIQTNKKKWCKNWQKGKKWQNSALMWRHNWLDDSCVTSFLLKTLQVHYIEDLIRLIWENGSSYMKKERPFSGSEIGPPEKSADISNIINKFFFLLCS